MPLAYRARMSQANVSTRLRRAHQRARSAAGFARRRSELRARREELMGRPRTWRETDGVSYVFLLFLLPVVCVFDFLLLGGTAVYLAQSLPSEASTFARFFVPAGFVLIHLALGYRIGRAQDAATRAEPYFWNGMAIVVNLVITALVVATQFSVWHLSDLPEEVGLVLLIGVSLLSLVLHGLILYMGGPLREAETFGADRVRNAWIDSKILRLDQQVDRTEALVLNELLRYLQEWERHNAQYPDATLPAPGPFEDSMREIINRHYGYYLLPRPKAPPSEGGRDAGREEPPPQQPNTTQPPLGNQQRDADAELFSEGE